MTTLQRLLIKQGYDGVGEPDGKLGSGTRAAVKKAQMKLGLPADSYPTVELLERLGGGQTSGAKP
jgi:peptidoglycan hydrolase-like protein with peptidoglycan-binding domain